ncbi:hypothetical protein [Altericroceibacterium endophyticum]|uniref:DUF883 family protein n=1 Tax=Altericroceibacterium endophyticum TaxID=1808508 RepID=A0A6I4T143_9SPHN|nr:hypothetical protein [Altericroceibacterium endophyticum]MXO64598.1 hypothetical protein [Altericroceibacterium endophyticum]
MVEAKPTTSPEVTKSEEIEKRVEAATNRNTARQPSNLEKAGEKAIEAKDRFTDFAKEHPLTVAAGGLALGIVISAMFPRSPTRKAGAKAAKRAAGLAGIAADMAMAYAQQAADVTEKVGRRGAEKLEDLGDDVGDRTRIFRRGAHYRMEGASDHARTLARETNKKMRRTLRHRIS